MDPLTIIGYINAARALGELAVTASGASEKVHTLITRSRTENRDVTLEEWNGLAGTRHEALAALEASIEARKALGED